MNKKLILLLIITAVLLSSLFILPQVGLTAPEQQQQVFYLKGSGKSLKSFLKVGDVIQCTVTGFTFDGKVRLTCFKVTATPPPPSPTPYPSP